MFRAGRESTGGGEAQHRKGGLELNQINEFTVPTRSRGLPWAGAPVGDVRSEDDAASPPGSTVTQSAGDQGGQRTPGEQGARVNSANIVSGRKGKIEFLGMASGAARQGINHGRMLSCPRTDHEHAGAHNLIN